MVVTLTFLWILFADMIFLFVMNYFHVTSNTRSHETLKNYSYIDYFAVSKCIEPDITHFYNIVNAFNLSDHNPIHIVLNIKHLIDESKASVNIKNVGNKNIKTLRWDRANLDSYYECTRQLIQPTFDSLCNFYETATGIVVDCNTDRSNVGNLLKKAFNDAVKTCIEK